jgi:two-component system, NarL family, response regulator NreC
VHDHVLLRQGLKRLLEDQPDLEVVAEAGNAAEALQRVFEHRPEIVIADANLFGSAPEQVEQLVLRQSAASKVLFLTMYEPRPARDAQSDSASYAVRETSAQEIVDAVRRTHARGNGSVQDLPKRKSEEWLEESQRSQKRSLTSREREVLKLLVEGRTVRSTAAVLGLSIKTVDAHKFNLMRKLGIHNKAELVLWAIQKRVVKLPANS